MLRRLPVIALSLLAPTMIAPVGTDAATVDLDWLIGTHHGTVLINQGDTVRWTWGDALPHSCRATGGLFNSGILTGLGTQFSFTFDTQGSFHYFCTVHGAQNMDGTIHVGPPVSVERSSWSGVKSLYR